MKKLLSLLLVFGLCFSLVGCGESENKEPKEVKNILEKDGYEISLNTDESGDMIIIQNIDIYNDKQIQISIIFNKDDISTIVIADFENDNICQLFPKLDEKGDSIFYDNFNDIGIELNDIKTFATWYRENFNE